MSAALSVRDLKASVRETSILKGLNLEVPFGEVHALMGPNGSGKSTLCHVLTGRSDYDVSGEAFLGDEPLLGLSVAERAQAGLMQAFQYPVVLPGVTLEHLLTEASAERGEDWETIEPRFREATERFDMDRFLHRSVNVDLSGGEKKRSEIFQMAVLRPRLAVLDEIDSGLDIDAVREVAEAVTAMRGPDVGILMITHYSRILRYLTPDRIHVMIGGQIVQSGGPELAEELEDGGYEAVRKRLGIELEAAATEKKASEFFTETPFDL